MAGDPPDETTVYQTTPPGRPAPPDRPVPPGRRGRRTPPRLFALCDPDGVVAAYGMALPDGSAVTVQWTDGAPGSLGSWSSPEAPARLWCLGVTWLDSGAGKGPPAPPVRS